MAKSKKQLAVIELKALRNALTYNPKTGEFIWRVHRNSYGGKVKPGAIAGTPKLDKDGGTHISIGVNGKRYRAHRLAWLFMTGKWPDHDVDHEDGNRSHNWWTNLRHADDRQNNMNRHKITASNKSGKTGVSWVAHRNQWMSRITVDYKHIHLGMFDRDELDKAIAVRRAAELKYYGKYAPTEVVVQQKSKKELRALPNERPAPKLSCRNVSGKEGVSWDTRSGAWRVTLQHEGRQIDFGLFDEDKLADAIKARRDGELKYRGKYSPK